MHILFLTDNFPPETNAPATRTVEHAQEWVQAGHQVSVITCAPNFPKGKVYDGYRNKLWQKETIQGITVIRVWSFITANEGFVLRVLDYVSYMIMAIFASIFVRKVDVIVGTSPQFFTACAAAVVSVFKRCPWVFELRDIWPESIRAVDAMKGSRVLDILERLELTLYRRASLVVSVTQAFRENLVTRGIERAKIQVVTNGVNLDRFSPRTKDPELLAQHKLEECFVAGYIGTLGMAHGLDTLIDVARVLKDDPDAANMRVVIMGHGAERSHLEQRVKAEKLDNLLLLDSVSKDEVIRYLSLLDTSIIHLRKSDLFKTVIPSKMFECMAMALPILHGVEGESADIVIENDIGLTVEPENADRMAVALKRLRDDADLRVRLEENGPKAAAKFNRKRLAAEMLEMLVSCASERSAAGGQRG